MRRTQPAVLSAVLALLAALLVPGTAQAAERGGAERGGTGYYLALGDSLAAGYQPGRGDDLDGGYVGVVHDVVSRLVRGTELVNLACSGETVVTLVHGGHCAKYAERSQLDAATEFLRENGRATRLITVDIGGNDVQRCIDRTTGVDEDCIRTGLGAVATVLPTVLADLRAAAPHARIVVLNYYNPFLGAYLLGAAGQQLAAESATVQKALNDAVAAAARATGARLADVATAFRSTSTRPVTLPGHGTVPTNVAVVCAWTWVCRPEPDIHANDAGYTVMAATVLLRLAWPVGRLPQPADSRAGTS